MHIQDEASTRSVSVCPVLITFAKEGRDVTGVCLFVSFFAATDSDEILYWGLAWGSNEELVIFWQ